MSRILISAEELAALTAVRPLKLLDATWRLDGGDAHAGFIEARLPGAVFFDLDGVSDGSSPLPHMLPDPAAFAEATRALGLDHDDTIVVYDQMGLFSAPRAWWMLRSMGARDVRVLDGGLPRWRAGGHPVEGGPAPKPAPGAFVATMDHDAVADAEQVRAALADPGVAVVDARSAPRFRGEAAEPRPGLRAGHMPGAVNLPYGALLNADGTMRAPSELRDAFARAGVGPDQAVVTTCGSGVTAAILTMALASLGRASRLYDGSWAEWGALSDAPVVRD